MTLKRISIFTTICLICLGLLVSPAMAAIAAVTGHFADVSKEPA